jgi:hypothetical protein
MVARGTGVSRTKASEQRSAEAIHRTRHAGPVVRNAEELRRLAAEESALALKDKPPPKA